MHGQQNIKFMYELSDNEAGLPRWETPHVLDIDLYNSCDSFNNPVKHLPYFFFGERTWLVTFIPINDITFLYCKIWVYRYQLTSLPQKNNFLC
jgi:hypothetical protein